MVSASLAISGPLLPDAYIAATRLPAEVPVTMSGWMPFSSSTSITPMWAKPRAAPPPSASATRGGRIGLGGGTTASATAGADAGAQTATGVVSGLIGIVAPQAASSADPTSTSATVEKRP